MVRVFGGPCVLLGRVCCLCVLLVCREGSVSCSCMGRCVACVECMEGILCCLCVLRVRGRPYVMRVWGGQCVLLMCVACGLIDG